MTWEALTALGTIFTGLVILVTVVLGARQLRAATDQLEQLQRSTQLDGTMRIFDVLRDPTFVQAQRFVFADLEQRLRDEGFRREAEQPAGVDDAAHPERIILKTFEEIGTYVKHSLLSGSAIYDFTGPVIIGAWKRLSGVVDAQRRNYGGNELWENFEFLYRESLQYDQMYHPDVLTNEGPNSPTIGG